jgi:hypothetical protein
MVLLNFIYFHLLMYGIHHEVIDFDICNKFNNLNIYINLLKWMVYLQTTYELCFGEAYFESCDFSHENTNIDVFVLIILLLFVSLVYQDIEFWFSNVEFWDIERRKRD